MSQIEKTSNGLAATPAGESPRGVSKRSKAAAPAMPVEEAAKPLETRPVDQALSAPTVIAQQFVAELDLLEKDAAQFMAERVQYSPASTLAKFAKAVEEAGQPASFQESISSAFSNARNGIGLLRAEYPTTEG